MARAYSDYMNEAIPFIAHMYPMPEFRACESPEEYEARYVETLNLRLRALRAFQPGALRRASTAYIIAERIVAGEAATAAAASAE